MVEELVAILGDSTSTYQHTKDQGEDEDRCYQRFDGKALVSKFSNAFFRTAKTRNAQYGKIGLEAGAIRKGKDGTRAKMDFEFAVRHYAESVFYEVHGWCEKNSDRLLGNVEAVLLASTNSFVRGPGGLLSGGAGHVSDPIGKAFLRELRDLIEENLLKCQSRFVRCIKANMKFLPKKIDRALVFNQLVSSGVIKALEIQEAGYPAKYKYAEFLSEFNYEIFTEKAEVVAGIMAETSDPRAMCEAVLRLHPGLQAVHESSGPEGLAGVQWGTTQLFFRSKAKTLLDAVKFEDLQSSMLERAKNIIFKAMAKAADTDVFVACLLYTSPSPRDS
eukprot:TRINITY_DN18308_c0_g1_i1.p1 TRINITY_DN18308_c0_g1~~TRINITY_DN18308_c0_g1_i1.p1  ORF type:complete len:332 (+),score=116.21 TRINITY_DN18308_c0_g1_i1:276-1271(+)